MNFLDNSGHIFELKSYSTKPIGHEYDENDYIFWLDSDTENFLSVNNYYMRSIYIVVDLTKYGFNINDYQQRSVDDELNVLIELQSNKYALIGSTYVQEKLSEGSSINDLFDISDNKLKKQSLNNEDLMFIKTESDTNNSSIPFAIVPFYVIGNSNEEGTWITNILIHLESKQDNSQEYCSISVGGEYRDNYEELMINAQNMGVFLPKNIIKAIYETSYYNNEFNEVIFNQKIKEYMLNYMNIKGEQGNFRSVIDSLNWFGWGDKIELSKLMKTDNEFKTQYFLEHFSANTDMLEAFQLFKNTSFVSLKVKLTNETGEYYKKIVDKERTQNYFEGEQNRVVESLLDKQIAVEYGFDNEKFIYMKQYYDFMMNELGLKLACLQYYYQKYFLPIHIKIHGAYLAHRVYANDIKFTTIPKVEMAAEPVFLPELNNNHGEYINEVEFLGQGTHYFTKLYDFFIDENYNEFDLYKGFENDPNKDFYYVNDTCINIPIKFKNYNKQYNCVLVLEKEIEDSGDYAYVYKIEQPFNYYEAFAYKTKSGELVEYKDILMAYREYESSNDNFSIYFKNGDLYDKVKNEISLKIEVTSSHTDEYDENYGYDLKEITDINSIGQTYSFNYCGNEIYIDAEKETYQNIVLNNKTYTLIVPPAENVNVNLFWGSEVENGELKTDMSFTCYRISQFEIKFKTINDDIEKIIKFSEAGLKTIDDLKILPKDVRILKYYDRRKYIIEHYDEYKWVELINSQYISTEDIFNIVYNTTKQNIDYDSFLVSTVLASTLDNYRKQNLTSADILNKLLSEDKFEGLLYDRDNELKLPVWKKFIDDLIIKRPTYSLDFSYTTNVPAEIVYESHFSFAQKEGRCYKNFIICPRIMQQTDMRYWQFSKFRLSLLVNNKWYEYRFCTKMPEPHIQMGRLKYGYWETDENFYSKFSQIKSLTKNQDGSGEVVFNNFMYEPDLVTVNNVNYYSDLLKENASQHIVNYNYDKVNLFEDCKNFIIFEKNNRSYIIKLNKKLIYTDNVINIPDDIDELSNLGEIVIYDYLHSTNETIYFVKYEQFDIYRYVSMTEDSDNPVEYKIQILNDINRASILKRTENNEYENVIEDCHIRKMIYEDKTLRDKYKFDINIPVAYKYLNSVCLFDLYKKQNVRNNVFLFKTNHNLSVNGVLFVNDVYSQKFLISGKQLWDESVNTGDIISNSGEVYVEGTADMWHDRWYNDDSWIPKVTKKYIYYLYKKTETDSEGNVITITKPTTEAYQEYNNKTHFYNSTFSNLKEINDFVQSRIDDYVIEGQPYKFLKDTNEKNKEMIYVTVNNGVTKNLLQIDIDFVYYENGNKKYYNNEIQQEYQLQYLYDTYYFESFNEKVPVKLEVKFYYNDYQIINNIPVILDLENNYLTYKIGNRTIYEDKIEHLSDTEIRYLDDNVHIDVIYVFKENINNRTKLYVAEGYDDLIVINRIEKITKNGKIIYRYYYEDDKSIELTEINDYTYLDYNRNPIGKDNPVNYWVEIYNLENTLNSNNDLIIHSWCPDEVESEEDSDLMSALEKILTSKDELEKQVINDTNRFNWKETEEVPQVTEYTYDHKIFIQQDLTTFNSSEYVFGWYDAYYDEDGNINDSFKEIHDSIKIVAVIRNKETKEPVSTENTDRLTNDTEKRYLIYDTIDSKIKIEDGEYITFYFTIDKKYKGSYDGYWITPYMYYDVEEYVEMAYNKPTDAEEKEISFELDTVKYSYGTNQTSEIVDLYANFYKEKLIVYRNKYSDSIVKILERSISDNSRAKVVDNRYNIEIDDYIELSESQQIDIIKNNPNAKYISVFEQIIDLKNYITKDNDTFQLDYDMYLMHDDKVWYCIFISRQTLDKADIFANIYNLKHTPIEFTAENGDEYKLVFNRFENRFLINRYYAENCDKMSSFDDTDIITAQLVNNDRLPLNLDISAKYRINSLSIGNDLDKEVNSNNEMAIINIPNNDNKYPQGFYNIDVNYSLDGFTQQSYKDTKKFKIYKT